MKKEENLQLSDLLALKKQADYSYHTEDNPVMSDKDYDKLCQVIESMGVSQDDQLQEVGAEPSKHFKKIAHSIPMYSLKKAHSKEDVLAWMRSIDNFLNPKVKSK